MKNVLFRFGEKKYTHIQLLSFFDWVMLEYCNQLKRVICMAVRVAFCLWAVHTARVVRRVPTSGQGSSEERSPVVSRFSELLFLDVPGTATEQVRSCGFGRNSSSFDKAPKIRDSVLLNSFESSCRSTSAKPAVRRSPQ